MYRTALAEDSKEHESCSIFQGLNSLPYNFHIWKVLIMLFVAV